MESKSREMKQQKKRAATGAKNMVMEREGRLDSQGLIAGAVVNPPTKKKIGKADVRSSIGQQANSGQVLKGGP